MFYRVSYFALFFNPQIYPAIVSKNPRMLNITFVKYAVRLGISCADFLRSLVIDYRAEFFLEYFSNYLWSSFSLFSLYECWVISLLLAEEKRGEVHSRSLMRVLICSIFSILFFFFLEKRDFRCKILKEVFKLDFF